MQQFMLALAMVKIKKDAEVGIKTVPAGINAGALSLLMDRTKDGVLLVMRRSVAPILMQCKHKGVAQSILNGTLIPDTS